MIAAASHNPMNWYNSLRFNWFDVAILLVLGFGYWRGRKHGMSREALPTSKWLIIVIAAGLGNQFLGQWLLKSGVIHKVFNGAFTETTAGFVTSYLLIALVVFIIFSILGKHFRERVAGSNAFGSGEYYLGMAAGTIRYACIIVFVMAFLNAPFYSSAQIEASKAYKARWYGGGLSGYSGDFIPDLSEVQSSVFVGSFMGPLIKNNMGYLLISSSVQTKKTASISLH